MRKCHFCFWYTFTLVMIAYFSALYILYALVGTLVKTGISFLSVCGMIFCGTTALLFQQYFQTGGFKKTVEFINNKTYPDNFSRQQQETSSIQV